jgi:hypothetical protein
MLRAGARPLRSASHLCLRVFCLTSPFLQVPWRDNFNAYFTDEVDRANAEFLGPKVDFSGAARQKQHMMLQQFIGKLRVYVTSGQCDGRKTGTIELMQQCGVVMDIVEETHMRTTMGEHHRTYEEHSYYLSVSKAVAAQYGAAQPPPGYNQAPLYQAAYSVPPLNVYDGGFPQASGGFCNKCGNAVPADSAFCSKCGAPIV